MFQYCVKSWKQTAALDPICYQCKNRVTQNIFPIFVISFRILLVTSVTTPPPALPSRWGSKSKTILFLNCLKVSKHTILFVLEKNVSREHDYSLGDEISCLFDQVSLLRSSAFHEVRYVTSLTFVKLPVSCKSGIPLQVTASKATQ